jgi:hypothetical protein
MSSDLPTSPAPSPPLIADGPTAAARPRRLRLLNVVISLFVVLNLLAVLRSNRPSWAGRAVDGALEETLGPYAAYRTRYVGWLLDRYAHLAGLNNRWEMFSHQSRFNWWYGIEAVTGPDTATELNVPLLGDRRTVMQRVLFDFREAKFHLNLYGSRDLRARYGRFLCRQLRDASAGQAPEVQGIRFLLYHQDLLDPAEAREQGTHLDPNIYHQTLNQVSCLPRG